MAHKKGLGSSRNGRDSNPKYLGVKVFSGQKVENVPGVDDQLRLVAERMMPAFA